MLGKTYEIKIMTVNETENDLGEIVKNTVEKGTVQGVIWQLNGEEQYPSDKDTRIITYRMACDIDFEITEDDEIYFPIKDKTFDIEVVNDVNNLGDRYEIDLKEVS